MQDHVDLLIVGAGPAGLSAACTAHSCGLDVSIVDDQVSYGGQIFRHISQATIQHILDAHDYTLGHTLAQDFEKSGVPFSPQTTVWGMEGNTVFCTHKGQSQIHSASKILFCTGGMERPVPFPGWTLPGVYTAGAAEIIFRSGGNLSKDNSPVVLTGNGPLLLSLAMHLLDKNIPILAWLDTGRMSHKLGSIIHMGHMFKDLPYLKKGMGMAMRILRSKIPIIQGVTQISAHGTFHVEEVTYIKNGKIHTIQTEHLIRHEGVIPRTHIPHALGVDLVWDPVQRYRYPKTDIYGRTSQSSIYVAGDATLVNGGEAAIYKGAIAGIAIAHELGVISKEESEKRSIAPLKELKRLCKARNYLRYIFAPNPQIFKIPDATLVCRCECVTAKDIRDAVQEGYHTINEVKRVTRCGMGPCQGRMCSLALSEIISHELPTMPLSPLQARQPFRPITLGEYCQLHAK